MSNSHEPSYYEIALTNRQVVVAFVILLACLLTAFFSGVWVGRGGAESGAEQMARATPPPEQRAEGTSLEELEFFDRQGEQPARPEIEPPAREERPTTLAEDLAAEAGQPIPPPDPALGRETAPATPPAAPAPPPAPAAPPEAPRTTAPEPRPAAPAPAPAPVERRAAADDGDGAEPADGSVVIQVFATPERQEAARVRDRLRNGGQNAFLSPVTVDGRTLFRVRIGPFGSREEAEGVAKTVQKTYRLDTWVTQ